MKTCLRPRTAALVALHAAATRRPAPASCSHRPHIPCWVPALPVALFHLCHIPACGAGCGIEHVGARELVEACRAAGLKTAVASSADRVKVRCKGRVFQNILTRAAPLSRSCPQPHAVLIRSALHIVGRRWMPS